MAIASDIEVERGTNRPTHIPAEQWALRVNLAACYRIFDHLGWNEVRPSPTIPHGTPINPRNTTAFP